MRGIVKEQTAMPEKTPRANDHETRIVRLETGLQQVSDTVEKLAALVHEQSNEIREQGAVVERELKALSIAVTQAGAPRRTDWHLVVEIVGIAIGVGALVFIPLNMRMAYAEQQCEERHSHNADGLSQLRVTLQRESELITTDIKTQVGTVSTKYDKEIQNLGDRLVGRMNDFERARSERDDREMEELRQWRMRGMGLCPDSKPRP